MFELDTENIGAMYKEATRLALKCGPKGGPRQMEFIRGRWQGMREALVALGYEDQIDIWDGEAAEEVEKEKGVMHQDIRKLGRMIWPGGGGK